MEEKRKKLSDEEFHLISAWLGRVKLDSEIDIVGVDNGRDVFMDYGTGALISLEEGFREIADAVAYPLTHEGFSEDENRKFIELLREFGVDRKQLEYIESLKDGER